MAYISNKDKKFQEQQEQKAIETKKAIKDPSKSKFWKVMNLLLIGLMVILPLVLVIVLIIKASN